MSGDDGALVDYARLADRHRQVSDCYSRVRSAADPRIAWEMWRGEMAHVRSPVDGRRDMLPTFAYDPDWRTFGEFVPATPLLVTVEPLQVLCIGTVSVEIPYDAPIDLEMYWVSGHPGGLFLPFGDPTNGDSTPPAGRCLIDQSAGADLGGDGGRWVLDFNFAYDASADLGWVMAGPRVTSPNRIPVPVLAGERLR